jgi:transcriptional regulator with PAS, ATPase and Fis domain
VSSASVMTDVIAYEDELLWDTMGFIMPVMFRNRVLGFLGLGTKGRFGPPDEEEFRVFRLLGLSIGICIQNMIAGKRAIREQIRAERSGTVVFPRVQEEAVPEPGSEPIIGRSTGIQHVLRVCDRAAETDASVLITGESGTGKELLAKRLHSRSRRSAAPFVPIHCSAIPATLIESELFGYKKGAFTGAVADRRGLLETASGGTVFLDEIGDLDPLVQVKLLRVLEERRLTPIGGRTEYDVDFRLVAATNVDLAAAVLEKRFREDLLYRINTVQLHSPPLRERPDDISLLAQSFLQEAAARHGKAVAGFDDEVVRMFAHYGWPGNVRQLMNAVEHAVIMADDQLICRSDLPEELVRPAQDLLRHHLTTLPELVARFEQEQVIRPLEGSDGNRVRAGRSLGVNRNRRNYLLRKYGIR